MIKAEYGGSVEFLVAHGYGPQGKAASGTSRRRVLGMLAGGVVANLVSDAMRGAGGYLWTRIRPGRRTARVGQSRVGGPDSVGGVFMLDKNTPFMLDKNTPFRL